MTCTLCIIYCHKVQYTTNSSQDSSVLLPALTLVETDVKELWWLFSKVLSRWWLAGGEMSGQGLVGKVSGLVSGDDEVSLPSSNCSLPSLLSFEIVLVTSDANLELLATCSEFPGSSSLLNFIPLFVSTSSLPLAVGSTSECLWTGVRSSPQCISACGILEGELPREVPKFDLSFILVTDWEGGIITCEIGIVLDELSPPLASCTCGWCKPNGLIRISDRDWSCEDEERGKLGEYFLTSWSISASQLRHVGYMYIWTANTIINHSNCLHAVTTKGQKVHYNLLPLSRANSLSQLVSIMLW